MKLAIFTGPRQITIEERAEPPLAAGEALVEVLGCTLCASDLHSFTGRRSVAVPTVLGHEIVGRVVRLGPPSVLGPVSCLDGSPLAVGDRIVWAVVASCGECLRCRRGLPQKCITGVKYGHAVAAPGREALGGLASHCLLLPGTSIVRLPDGMPLEVACPAGCSTATVAAALEPAGDLMGRRVAVLGLGMLGLTACGMAREAGAAEVVGIDPEPERTARSLRFGATRAASPADLPSLSAAAAGGGFDLVLEMSGSPSGVTAALDACGVGGGVHLVGSVFPAGRVPLDPEQLIRRQATLRGIHNYAPRHLATAVAFLEASEDRVPFAELVEAWYPLESISEAFGAALASRAVRIGVRP